LKHALAEAARDWSKKHPRFVEALTSTEQNSGAISAVFSSALDEITRRALDLPPPERKPGDIDVLVLPEHFGRLARGMGAAVMLNNIQFQTGDGFQAVMRAREAIAMVGDDEVQFMDPLSAMSVGGASYKTTYTGAAARERFVVETDEGRLPLAHPVDDIGIAAILQRGGDKSDQAKLVVQLATGAMEDPYALDRARVMGWDQRVWGAVAVAHTELHGGVPMPPVPMANMANQNGPLA
jgi:hypothetical protein